MKSLTYLPYYLANFCAQLAVAQSPTDSTDGNHVSAPQVAVYESGNLIPKGPVQVPSSSEDAPPKSVVHFFQGFASESSEEALLNLVAKAIAKEPEHACEIVKEAIAISAADAELVAKIVETACLEAPEKMRIIAQCALAANPDALEEIQQVLAKLDPAASEGDSFLSGEGQLSGKETIEPPPVPEPKYEFEPPPPFPFPPPIPTPPPATDNDI